VRVAAGAGRAYARDVTQKVVLRLAPGVPPPDPGLRLLLGTVLHRDVLEAFAAGTATLDGFAVLPTGRLTPVDGEQVEVLLLQPAGAGTPSDRPRVAGLPSLTGLGHGDHVCWTYRSHEGYLAAARSCLAEGAGRGERLLHAGAGSAEQLRDELDGLPGRDAMLASGQLSLHPLGTLYEAAAWKRPDEQVARFRRATERALDDGWPGMRVVADMTPLAEVTELTAVAAYELTADAMIADHRLVGVCAYSEQAPGARLVAALHRQQHRDTVADGALPFAVWRRDGRIHLGGQVGAAADDVMPALEVAAASADRVTLDLSALVSLDHDAARRLAGWLERRTGPAGAPRVTGASAVVRRELVAAGAAWAVA